MNMKKNELKKIWAKQWLGQMMVGPDNGWTR